MILIVILWIWYQFDTVTSFKSVYIRLYQKCDQTLDPIMLDHMHENREFKK